MKQLKTIFKISVVAFMLSGCSSTDKLPPQPSFKQQLHSCVRYSNTEFQLSCLKDLRAISFSERAVILYELAHRSALNPSSRMNFADYGKKLADLMKNREIHQWPRKELKYEVTALLASRIHGEEYQSYKDARAQVDKKCGPLKPTNFSYDNTRLIEAYAAASCWLYLSEPDSTSYQGAINEMLDLVEFQRARGARIALPNPDERYHSALPYALFIAH